MATDQHGRGARLDEAVGLGERGASQVKAAASAASIRTRSFGQSEWMASWSVVAPGSARAGCGKKSRKVEADLLERIDIVSLDALTSV